jgi:hypothetical protein
MLFKKIIRAYGKSHMKTYQLLKLMVQLVIRHCFKGLNFYPITLSDEYITCALKTKQSIHFSRKLLGEKNVCILYSCHCRTTVYYQTEPHYVAVRGCSYNSLSPFSAICPSSFLASSVGDVSFN